MMKEIPILFSTPMVQAVLAGRKTQTRRLVQPMRGRQSEWLTPELINSVPHGEIIKGEWQMHHPKAGQFHAGVEVAYDSPLGWIKCPHGQPGDLLYARETFRKYCKVDENGYTRYDQEVIEFAADNPPMINECDGDGCTMFKKDGTEKFIPWRPSIHMPKSIARIWLQVESIRVERLQDITEEDAKAEGVEKINESVFCWRHYGGKCAGCSDARTSFNSLWCSINGDESWESNPWVWAINFDVLSTTGKLATCPPKS